jgi:hypothetical protein
VFLHLTTNYGLKFNWNRILCDWCRDPLSGADRIHFLQNQQQQGYKFKTSQTFHFDLLRDACNSCSLSFIEGLIGFGVKYRSQDYDVLLRTAAGNNNPGVLEYWLQQSNSHTPHCLGRLLVKSLGNQSDINTQLLTEKYNAVLYHGQFCSDSIQSATERKYVMILVLFERIANESKVWP